MRCYEVMYKLITPIGMLCTILAILLWDMRKVKMLSDVIHDDHRSKFVIMNESSLHSWYSSADLCQLEQTTVLGKSDSNCTNIVDPDHTRPAFCSLGYSGNAKCNLNSSHFRLQLREGDLGNPRNMYLYDALTRLAISRKPLVFVGDAISRLSYNALICEMYRSNAIETKLTQAHTSAAEVSPYSNFTLNWKGSKLSLQLIFFHMAHVFSRSSASSSSRDRAYDHDPRFHAEYSDARMTSSSASASALEPFKDSTTGQNNISSSIGGSGSSHKHLSSSREEITHSVSLTDLWNKLNDIILKNGGFVLIANVGVWYNTRERFRNELPAFIRMLSLFGKQNDVFFRESSAQHWNHTKNGYFQNGALPQDGSCSALQDSSPSLDWRNRDVKLLLDKLALGGVESNIHLIGFRDVTAPLSDLHPVEDFSEDCTRFCYLPQMWQSVWRDLDVVS